MRSALLGGVPRAPLTAAALNIIAVGDSWTEGFYASDPRSTHGYVGVAAAALGIPILNSGVGGQTITDRSSVASYEYTATNNMMYLGPTAVDAHLDPTKLNVLLAFEAINEAITGRTGSQIHAARAAYYTARKAAAHAIGARLHICWLTCPPAYVGVTPNYGSQASIDAMNGAIVLSNSMLKAASPGQVADSYVDVAAIPQFVLPDFTAGSFDASGFYSTERIHPIDPGHAAIGARIVADNRKWRRLVNA